MSLWNRFTNKLQSLLPWRHGADRALDLGFGGGHQELRRGSGTAGPQTDIVSRPLVRAAANSSDGIVGRVRGRKHGA